MAIHECGRRDAAPTSKQIVRFCHACNRRDPGRAEKYATDNECAYLTLNAATDDLVPLFGKFGFTVEDGQATSLAMEKKIAR